MRQKNKTMNWIDFGFTITSSLFQLMVGILVISSISLYTAKVAASGVLSNKNSNNDKVVTNVVNVMSDGFPPSIESTYKMPLKFNSYNIDEFFPFNLLKDFVAPLPILNYLITIIKDVINIHTIIIEKVYEQVNKLPESVILTLFLYLTPLFWFVMFFVNFILMGIYHLINLPSAFKDKPDGIANWFSPLAWILLIIYGIFLMMPLELFVIAPVIMLFSYLSPLCVTASANNKPYNFFTSIVDMVVYKRQVILWLITFTFLRAVIMNLDTYNTIGTILAIMCLAGFTNVYSQYIPPCINQKTK